MCYRIGRKKGELIMNTYRPEEQGINQTSSQYNQGGTYGYNNTQYNQGGTY